jgi:hypothetical protein
MTMTAPCPHFPTLTSLLATAVLACVSFRGVRAQEVASSGAPAVPVLVTADDFAALKTSSPFLRSLDLSQTLKLTGIARIEGQLYATLVDRESKKAHLVSQAANPEGWRMVAVAGNQADLTTVTAEIAMASGEVFEVRYDEQQLSPPENRPSAPGGSRGGPPRGPDGRPVYANFREGISGDGFRGPPPPEMVAKLEKLDEKTRDRLILGIREYREKNPDVGSEERQRLFTRMVDEELRKSR